MGSKLHFIFCQAISKNTLKISSKPIKQQKQPTNKQKPSETLNLTWNSNPTVSSRHKQVTKTKTEQVQILI